MIKESGGVPGALLQALESLSLEDAYDDTCAWVNTFVGEHARIEHLCDGQREGILGVVACERRPAQATRTLPSARACGEDPPEALQLTPPRPAL